MLSFLFGFISFLDPTRRPQPGSGLDSGLGLLCCCCLRDHQQVLASHLTRQHGGPDGCAGPVALKQAPDIQRAAVRYIFSRVLFQKYCSLFSKARPRWNVLIRKKRTSKQRLRPWTLTFSWAVRRKCGLWLSFSLLRSAKHQLIIIIIFWYIKHQNWKSVYFLQYKVKNKEIFVLYETLFCLFVKASRIRRSWQTPVASPLSERWKLISSLWK